VPRRSTLRTSPVACAAFSGNVRSSGRSCISRSTGATRVSACNWPLTSVHHCSAQAFAAASEAKPSAGRFALTNFTSASTLPFVFGVVRSGGSRVEAIVRRQTNELWIEHRGTRDEADGDRLRVIEQHVGRHPTQRVETPRQPLRQNGKPLTSEEAHVLPAAPAEHRTEAQQLALTGGRGHAADVAPINHQELAWRTHPRTVDASVLA
jgi:hypothetical protein